MLSGLKAKIEENKLSKFKKAFKLKDLSGKATTIQSKLPDTVSRSLDGRIRDADLRDRKRIQDLLHFDKDDRRGNTEQTRTDMRTILSNTLGRGIALDKAESLRDVLAKQPPNKLQALVNELNTEGAFAPGVLAKHLLKTSGRDPKADFAELKDILVAFPPAPDRAGKVECHESNLTMGRDDGGNLKIVNQSIKYVGLKVPEGNKNLSPEKVEELKSLFRDVVDVNYSRQGVALEMMRSVRQEEGSEKLKLRRGKVDFAQAFKNFDADGAKVAKRYGSGDCMVLAERLAAKLQKEGISGQVVGMNEDKHVQQRDKETISYEDAGRISGGMTHTDVVVPYTDQDGKERVLLLVPGMGKPKDGEDAVDGETVIYDETMEDFLRMDAARRMSGPDGGELDTSAMQKRQLGFMTNIMLTGNKADEKSKDICGLDIMRGKLWLNGSATKKTKVPKGLDDKVAGWGKNERGAIEVDLKEMLKNPREKLTIQVWNEEQQEYVAKQTTKAEALVAGLIAIGKQFGQPPDFVDNILTLGAHLDEYRETVIDPEIRAMYE